MSFLSKDEIIFLSNFVIQGAEVFFKLNSIMKSFCYASDNYAKVSAQCVTCTDNLNDRGTPFWWLLSLSVVFDTKMTVKGSYVDEITAT